ncbi:hypothetical protein F3Y22_tig00116978pilonHSYRG00013 [Hibiscus syriacus]|uniref:Uncharacterized protein n=1 Tax=Hibiscus syriacus TaxID=106335 RepID=A0A6A2XN60_HIBSY|nr:hypothetical protein F3Y22_tig00116978pilonHSYRG00013 [Hibiscus syriacus]
MPLSSRIFPILPISKSNLDMRKCSGVQTTECHGNASGKELLGSSQKLEPFAWDDEVNISPHGAVKTIAFPSNNASRCSGKPPYFPVVATTTVHDQLRFHASNLC